MRRRWQRCISRQRNAPFLVNAHSCACGITNRVCERRERVSQANWCGMPVWFHHKTCGGPSYLMKPPAASVHDLFGGTADLSDPSPTITPVARSAIGLHARTSATTTPSRVILGRINGLIGRSTVRVRSASKPKMIKIFTALRRMPQLLAVN